MNIFQRISLLMKIQSLIGDIQKESMNKIDWKTTAFGLFAAIGLALSSGQVALPAIFVSIGKLMGVAGVALLGNAAKDSKQ